MAMHHYPAVRMRLFWWVCIAIMLCLNPASAQSDAQALTEKVKKEIVPSRSIIDLSKRISDLFPDPYSRVRALYVWMNLSISYDLESFKRGEVSNQDPESVWKKRKAVCQGYSELFHLVCNQMGIKSEIISGYSKGYGYQPGKRFAQTDHAWNAVLIDQKWILIDATWGSGYVDENDQYVKSSNMAFFDAKPDQFLLKHLPADPIWQLKPKPVTLQTWEKDTSYVKTVVERGEMEGNYLDTLSMHTKLDSGLQQYTSSWRAVRYNPKYGEGWYKISWYHYTKAWKLMSQLNDPAIQRNKAKATPLAKESIALLQTAEAYMDQLVKVDPSYREEVRAKKENIKQNIQNLREIAK